MITLVTLPPAFGLRNVSPFCLKVEMLLASLELPFELEEINNPGKAPRGKVPYLIDDGVTIPDSELIAEHLERKTGGSVYAGLDDRQRAEGVALARLCEDHLYGLGVASRWLDDHGWPHAVFYDEDLEPSRKMTFSNYRELAGRTVPTQIRIEPLDEETPF